MSYPCHEFVLWKDPCHFASWRGVFESDKIHTYKLLKIKKLLGRFFELMFTEITHKRLSTALIIDTRLVDLLSHRNQSKYLHSTHLTRNRDVPFHGL